MSNNTPDYDNLYFEPKAKGTLTEQWKHKELPEGWYWVLYKSDAVEPAEYQKWFNEKTQSYYTEFDYEEDIVAVIDNISYSEWFNMKHLALLANECLHERDKLKEQIERLEKQLRIAVKALDSLRGICYPQVAEKAFEKIKELEK